MIWALLESAPDAMVTVDSDGIIVVVNAQTEVLFGYRREELLGHTVEMLIPTRFRRIHPGHRATFTTAPHARPMGAHLELFARRHDGSEFPVEISLSPIETEQGLLMCSSIRDITERKAAEQNLSHFRAVVESSHDAIIGKDLNGVVTSWNAGAERLFGYTESEIRGRSISLLVPPGAEDDLPRMLRELRSGERVDDYETVRVRKDGTRIDVSLTLSPIRDSDGTVIGLSTIARDIGVRLHYQQQLRFLAEHDPLTGARNRRRFEQDVSDQISRSHRYGEQAALLFVDVDGFKHINDRYGHHTGDKTLKAIVVALNNRLRKDDIVARVGGDEFCVLLPYASASQAHAIAEDLQRVIGSAFPLDSDAVSGLELSASIGVVEINDQTESVDDIMAAADRAMYRSKADATLRDIGPINLSILRQQLP